MSDIKQIKIDSYLNKQFRFSDGIFTMREKIDQMISEGSRDLYFESVGSYKRCGERFDNKPTWGFQRPDGTWFKVGKIGADYINQKLGLCLDINAIEKTGTDKWKKENKHTRPGLHAGYMGW